MKALFIFLISAVILCSMKFQVKTELNISENSGNADKVNFQLPPAFSIEQTLTKNDSKKSIEDIDRSWYQKALERMETEEYDIVYSDELGAFQSPNRANNMRFIYHDNGFTAKPRTNKSSVIPADEWEIKFQITNDAYELHGNELKVSGNKAFIENENIRIDYANDKKGMRQDFTIKNKPEGAGALKFEFKADTKLKLITGADALIFKEENGSEKLKYSALKAWDANGKVLRAYFADSYELRVTNYEFKDNACVDINTIQNSSLLTRNSKLVTRNSSVVTRNSFSIIVNDEDAVYPVTIDPLSTTADWTKQHDQADAHEGFSVAAAGDVNGDGYSDVITAAPYFDNGQTDEGRVWVFLGSATGLQAAADWRAESNQNSSFFGWSVSAAGDVNGDGYSDIIIGANKYDSGQTDEGKVFLWFGSAGGLGANGTPTNADWSAESNQDSANFGYSVSCTGDVNGDGYSDVIAGAPFYDNGQSNEGRAYLYLGSSTGPSLSQDWRGESNQVNANFGSCVSGAGDVNGDGKSDVIIGAPLYDNNETDEGRVFLWYGTSSGLGANGTPSNSGWSAESNQISADFGISVSCAGDVNGDGYSDVIVGADLYNNPETDEGAAFVWYGSPTGIAANGTPVNAGWISESNQANAHFGISVSSAGDINGDGFADVIIGANLFDGSFSNEGKAFLWYGSNAGLAVSGTPANAGWSAGSGQADADFGICVSTAGDVNGDGYSDVIAGADLYDDGQVNEGQVYQFNGSASGLSSVINWTAEGNQNGSAFGNSVSTAGDVNGDGYSDVIIGAMSYDNGHTDEGRAFVYYGSSSGLSDSANWIAEGNKIGAFYGYRVSTAGDVNGDGYSDVIVGAPYYSNGQSIEGKVFVYYGSASGLSVSENWSAESNKIQAFFGWSVNTAGDVNGDGYSDVIVGAPYYSNGQNSEGMVFVYHGSASGLSANANWNTEGNQADASYGNSVSSAGDVNGDGYSDVIIGAPYFNNGQLDEGKAYVYHGSPSGLSQSANWTNESNQASSRYGFCVSEAGDVNGDGYSDVIVGAFQYSHGESNEGRAFVYYGSVSGLSASENWTAESNSAGASFGLSLSTAGDVNGDGYSDVIVGAEQYNNKGRLYVYQGSDSGLSVTANWFVNCDITGSMFGHSVSSAGDVNGDGYSDVIAGALFYDNGQTDEGKAFVYYGNGGTGMRSTVMQYKPGSGDIVSSGGLTGTDGQVRFNMFGKSPYGRADGKIVYEYKENGMPFSGAVITNSTSSSGSGSYTDLGTTLSGVQINSDVSGLMNNKEYKWRTRVQYNPANNPLQKFGPWRYYNSYIPQPTGNFRAQSVPTTEKTLALTMLIQGFYNSETNTMISDTVMVNIRNYTSPYSIIDSRKYVVSPAGHINYQTSNASVLNNTLYYIQLSHRNSLETWNNGSVFTLSNQTFDFTTSASQAYGNNIIQVDASPARFADYSGDVNQDGIIDLNDITIVFNDASNFLTGYQVSDVNGDNIVDLIDLTITFNNSNLFVGVIKP